ncbi:MAG: hypothetical protein WBM50_00210 [Acidimicrobiales bacterium]
MGNESEQPGSAGSIDEHQFVDWLANVVEIDAPDDDGTVAPGHRSVRSSPPGEPNESAGYRSAGRLRQIGLRARNRYQHLPGWVLLPQIFLAAGWARAGVAHAMSRRWWNGEEILEFLALDTDLRVGLYRHVLTGIVEPFPAVTAAVVGLTELVIAILLAANVRVKSALVAAAFLNVQFMLAGVVNPSIFYLVAGLGIAIWLLETTASPETISRLTRVGIGLGAVASLLLAPSIRTIEPETAIEDPALVLIFFIALSVASLWWVNQRTALAGDTPAALAGEDHGPAGRSRESPVSMMWLSVTAVATVAIVVTGLVVVANQDAKEGVAGAGSDAAELGSLGRPYAFGQGVTLSYDDLETGIQREWQVQVVDAVLQDGAELGLASPRAERRLAMARIQLRYPGWEGRRADLRFNAFDKSGRAFPANREGCGAQRAPLPPEGRALTTSGEAQGWLCWWVSAADLESLLLGVEAEPADGVVYLSLGRE